MSQPTSPRPVPRIEYVESFVTTGHEPVPMDDQPWHVRYIGGNGEPIATSEQLVDVGDCDVNAVAMGALFGLRDLEVTLAADGTSWLTNFDGDGIPILHVRHDASHRRDL